MTKKRLLSVLVVLCTTSMYSLAQTDTIRVSTAAELQAALNNNPTGYIHITQDIDLSSGWTYISEFKGVLEGEVLDGETVPYLKDDSGNEVKDENNASVQLVGHRITGLNTCMFSKLTGATIRNIAFEKIAYEAGGSSEALNGVLALEAESTTFESLTFDRCTIENGNILSSSANYVGLVAGKATECTLQHISVAQSSISPEGCIVGSLVGKALGSTFECCVNDVLTTVYGEGGTVALDSRVGGICGWAAKTDGGKACSFNGCVNCGMVAEGQKGDMLGGIVGYSEGATFEYCQNFSLVSHVSDKSELDKWAMAVASSYNWYGSLEASRLSLLVLGHKMCEWDAVLMPGQVEYGTMLSTQYSMYMVTSLYLIALEVAWAVYQAQDPDEVGGICGCAKGGSFTSCINSGYVQCYDAFCGGIVGRATDGVTISHCLNTGKVQGDEQTGGIVGTLGGAANWLAEAVSDPAASTIEACVNTGSVYADASTVGPIYGELAKNATSNKHHYTIGTTNSTDADADIHTVTYQTMASGQVAYDINTATGDTVWGQKVGQMKVPHPMTNADASKGTVIPLVGADGNAINTNIDCWTHVSTEAELQAALNDQYVWVKLDSDITFVNNTDHNHARFASYELPFCGKIDGQGHKISGYQRTYSMSEEDENGWDIGLFDYAKNATFENLTLADFAIYATSRIGALVGNSTGCVYRNITVGTTEHRSIMVRGTGYYVGGMVGYSQGDMFEDCNIQMDPATGAIGSFTPIYSDGFSSSPDANVGGFAGAAYGSTFINCVNSRDVYGDDDRVGGFVGSAQKCTFKDCVNNAIVSHVSPPGGYDDELGGIAGYADDCDFIRCTNTGTCRGADAYMGGIAGYAENNSTFVDCLNTGTVSGDEQTGGIVGYIEDGKIRNCLVTGGVYVEEGGTEVKGWNKLFGDQDDSSWLNNYIGHTSYDAGSGGRALVTSEQLASGQVAWWLNESDADITVWRQNLSGDDIDATPVLDKTHAVVTQGSLTNIRYISNEAELIQFRQDVATDATVAAQMVVLTADIRLSNPASGTSSNWTPIGLINKNGKSESSEWDFSHAFHGTFLGNGHTISNLQLGNSSSNYQGFFGVVTVGAVISDLIIEGEVKGTIGVGGIVGAAEAASNNAGGTVTILRCGNRATVTASTNAGGIVGGVYTCDNLELVVKDCWNTGIVTGDESAALCGNVKKKATFTNCWNSGQFSGSSDGSNEYFVRRSSSTQTLTLTNCYQLLGTAFQESVNEVSTDELANGYLCYKLNGDKVSGDGLVWQQDVATDMQPLFGDKGLYHTRTMTNNYGTVCLPFALRSNDYVSFYTLSSVDGSSLVFTYADTVSAGTPCLAFRQNEDTNVLMEGAGTAYETTPRSMTAVNGYTPVGTYTGVEGKKGCLYIAKDTIWYATKAVTIPAYRAWFEGNKPSQALAIRLGGTTEVIALKEEDSTSGSANAYIYDLSGRRYNPGTTLAPGIYIVGGKKVMVSNKDYE